MLMCAFCHRKDEDVRQHPFGLAMARLVISAHNDCLPKPEWHKTAHEGVSISW